MDRQRIEASARLLADLRLRRAGLTEPIEDLPCDLRPGDLDEAHLVQDVLAGLLADAGAGPLVGWKIGCTTPVMQRYLGIPHPCAGHLYGATVHAERASISAAAHHRLGLECEIAVRLARPIEPAPGGHTAGTVAPAVGAVMASVEIVEHRFRDFERAAVASLVADDFFSAGCVLGAPREPAGLADLAALTGGFSLDGAPPARTGTGREILGHPLNALAWLADHVAARGGHLEAGTVVTLGSVVRTLYPAPGSVVTARFEGLPPARVDVRP